MLYAVAAFYVLWYIAYFANILLFVAVDGELYSRMNDDAMISMRHAWNLANGNGLVWNPGEYIQGYSNLLMTLFMALIHLIFDQRHAVMAVNMSGLVFMLVTAYGAGKITECICHEGASSRERDVAGIMAFALVLCFYPLSYWAITGMETSMLTMLVTMGMLFTFRYGDGRKSKYLYLAALMFSLALLTRTETVLICSLAGLYIMSLLRSPGHRQHLRHVLAAAGAYVATGIGLLLFQYTYYGEWLPNTYTLKLVGIPLYSRVLDGISYLSPFLFSILIIVACVAADMIRGHSRKKILMCCIVVVMILYNIYIGGDVYEYYRIPAPAMPLLLGLFAASMVRTMDIEILWSAKLDHSLKLVEMIGMRLRRLLMAALLPSAVLALNFEYLEEIAMRERERHLVRYERHTNRALLLDRFLSDQATIGVASAGVTGYYTNRVGIDFFGKMDRYLASLPPDLTGSVAYQDFRVRSFVGHNKYDLEYSIKKKKPTWIEFFIYGQEDLSEWVMQNYVFVTCAEDDEFFGHCDFFFLEGSPHVNWELLKRHGYRVEQLSTILAS